ncbi:LysM peptidoglycan-binding domain-containing protein [Rathayibacter soli]|uniref:LysM peptidoglycan-binding domain-containing protein n=1 Tax=Rathayibacter soli TaxID=3144168 RepID=UPI0027E3DFC1|nr:LysM peptidoglycan-binding domain-containing protein [Glaciibacter superstes]
MSTASIAPAARMRLRLTRRGRVVLTVLTATPLLAALLAFGFNGAAAAASGGGNTTSFSHVTVTTGESLWKIAETVAPSADPRDVVAAITDLNQLSTSVLVPGQRLAIPAQYDR